MPVDEKTRDALNPSLRILAVTGESIEIDKKTSRLIGDLKNRSHDSLQDHGITLFPYIFIAKQSELDSRDDDEE